MPDIDVTELMLDPDLVDEFDVVRRVEEVGENGRAVTRDTWLKDIVGAVFPEDTAGLMRRDDSQEVMAKISVVTIFQLRGASRGMVPSDNPNYQPDIVVIDGNAYLVTLVLPFSRFGRGFTEAICTFHGMLQRPPV